MTELSYQDTLGHYGTGDRNEVAWLRANGAGCLGYTVDRNSKRERYVKEWYEGREACLEMVEEYYGSESGQFVRDFSKEVREFVLRSKKIMGEQ